MVPDKRCTLFLQYTSYCARILLYDSVGDDWIDLSTIDLRRSKGSSLSVSYSPQDQTLHVSVGKETVDVEVGFVCHSRERKEVRFIIFSHVDTRYDLVKAVTVGRGAVCDDPNSVARVIPVFHKQTT